MVKGLRAEDVKEAVEFKQFLPPPSDWRDRIILAAARACLASQEQTPDYEAAAQKAEELLRGAYAWDIMPAPLARAIVDAALVGFHPQPTEEIPEVPT